MLSQSYGTPLAVGRGGGGGSARAVVVAVAVLVQHRALCDLQDRVPCVQQRAMQDVHTLLPAQVAAVPVFLLDAARLRVLAPRLRKPAGTRAMVTSCHCQ